MIDTKQATPPGYAKALAVQKARRAIQLAAIGGRLLEAYLYDARRGRVANARQSQAVIADAIRKGKLTAKTTGDAGCLTLANALEERRVANAKRRLVADLKRKGL